MARGRLRRRLMENDGLGRMPEGRTGVIVFRNAFTAAVSLDGRRCCHEAQPS